MLTPVAINRAAVDEIMRNLAAATGGGKYQTADVIIALAEFTGRTVVSLNDTPIGGFDTLALLGEHIKRTLQAGYSTKGFDMGAINV